jgi:hypothetical protein
VIRAFEDEKRRSQEPGYVSSYDDFDGGDDDDSSRENTPRPTEVRPKQVQTAEAPRGPHTAPARQPESKPSDHGHRPHSQNFGAGILD